MAILARYIAFNDQPPYFKLEYGNLPEIQEGEILVKIVYTSLCRSDINTYIGKRKEKTPTILGHESVGIVYQIGSHGALVDAVGTKLVIGQRITWAIYASDPNDPMSLQGIPQKAKSLFKYGHEQLTNENTFHGGLAEYIVIRKNTPVLVLNSEISNEEASLINCSIATVCASFRIAGPVEGKRVLIAGVGMLGIFACAMAKQLKANSICAVDINQRRLDISKEYGATKTVLFGNLDLEQDDADVVIDFTGLNEVMEKGIRLLKIGGVAVWVGATFPQEALKLDAEQVIRKILTIKGIHNYNETDFIEAVRFLTRIKGVYDFSRFIENTFSLDETEKAFEYASTFNPYRVGISFNILT
ncbi:MAG: hypothetical protein RL335_485 [Bacteroidota bacterium]